MSLDEPITDSMPPERRRELLRPFYFAQVYERSDGSLVPPSGHRVTYFDAQGFERHEDSTRYTFWVDPSDGSWKHWRLRRFYPFETLVDLGIDEVLRQAGARVRV